MFYHYSNFYNFCIQADYSRSVFFINFSCKRCLRLEDFFIPQVIQGHFRSFAFSLIFF